MERKVYRHDSTSQEIGGRASPARSHINSLESAIGDAFDLPGKSMPTNYSNLHR
jgi:hypothetical protein